MRTCVVCGREAEVLVPNGLPGRWADQVALCGGCELAYLGAEDV